MGTKEFIKGYIEGLLDASSFIDTTKNSLFVMELRKEAEAKLKELEPQLSIWTPKGEVPIVVNDDDFYEEYSLIANRFNQFALQIYERKGNSGEDWIIPIPIDHPFNNEVIKTGYYVINDISDKYTKWTEYRLVNNLRLVNKETK